MRGIYVALLRGINVGGKNKLPMKDLAAMFAKGGATGVSTYIQSGNVIFSAAARVADALPGLVTAQIAERFGYRIPIVLRTAEQLAEAIRRNPYIAPGADLSGLHVLFLADLPTLQAVGTLDPQRSAPDEYAVRGRDVYFLLRTGAANTKLTNAYFDSRLSTVSTGRNWRTVLKLGELTTASSEARGPVDPR